MLFLSFSTRFTLTTAWHGTHTYHCSSFIAPRFQSTVSLLVSYLEKGSSSFLLRFQQRQPWSWSLARFLTEASLGQKDGVLSFYLPEMR
jgi:hypothetical protein